MHSLYPGALDTLPETSSHLCSDGWMEEHWMDAHVGSWEAFDDSDGHLDKELHFVFIKRAGKREIFLENRKKKPQIDVFMHLTVITNLYADTSHIKYDMMINHLCVG